MCGIAGWLGPVRDARERALSMTAALRHRGPDGRGVREWSEATLIHTRLSIIDLSSAGAQPMANEDGTVWTVFNGEIYNHKELRRSLQTRGHVFRGRSDTEVIPHLYEEEGAEFINRLRGMFALALYDSGNRTLILARDRFGIKPLFYAQSPHELAFASEIAALLALPSTNDRPDLQSIHDFAALFYIPAPATFYAGIRAVEPGHFIEAQLGADGRVHWKSKQYHRWVIDRDRRTTFADAVEQTDELLATAVAREIESDVPLGALLSGGIDSSLVCAAAQKPLNGRLQTFNVKFAEKEYDETWAALAVAKHIGSRHQVLEMDRGEGTWDRITELLAHVGQPFADTSLFAVNAVCRRMRQHVTVALSGDGGDEAFSGYGIYWRLARIAGYQNVPVPLWYGAAACLVPLACAGIVPGYWPARVTDMATADAISLIQSLFTWMPAKQHRQLCRATNVLPLRRLFERQWECHLPPNASRTEDLSALASEMNIRLLLANDFLFKVDAASMKESLEIRVPMLDEDLFAFGLSLPHRLKVKARTCKLILREIAKRKLPAQVAAKSKGGFAVPVDSWVDANFRLQLRDALLGPGSGLPEFFNPEFYRPRIEAFCDNRPFFSVPRDVLYQFAIMLLSIQVTLEERRRRRSAAQQQSFRELAAQA